MSSESVVACLSVPIEAPSSCLVCDWSEEKEDLDPEYFTLKELLCEVKIVIIHIYSECK